MLFHIPTLKSCELKVAPYSFTITRALGTKASVICACSNENMFFDVLLHQHEHKKQN